MRTAWGRLTATPAILDPRDARSGRLLAAILVTLIGLGTTSITVQLVVVPDFLPSFLAVSAAMLLLVAAYALNRRGHRRAAAGVTAGVTTTAALAAAAVNPDDVFALAFALFGVLLASMLISTRAAAIVAVVGIVGVGALSWIRPEIPGPVLIGAAGYLAIGSALVVIAARHRDRLEADRLAEERRVRRQLELADRLASLGTLSSTIAHEINNPLTFVMAHLDRLARDDRDAERRREAIEHCRSGVERISTIVRGMTRFARGSEEITEPVDVARALEAAIAMAEPQIRGRAQLVRRIEPVPPASANQGRLEQVFLNLLLNAAHAMPDGDPDGHEIVVRLGVGEAGTIEVEVADTGTGMAPEVLERVFEPFFSTKPVGEGTGLGLSVCHGIVTSLGGRITAHSRPGVGTIVRVGLPRA
jgi:signal transduction histidine kinase